MFTCYHGNSIDYVIITYEYNYLIMNSLTTNDRKFHCISGHGSVVQKYEDEFILGCIAVLRQFLLLHSDLIVFLYRY